MWKKFTQYLERVELVASTNGLNHARGTGQPFIMGNVLAEPLVRISTMPVTNKSITNFQLDLTKEILSTMQAVGQTGESCVFKNFFIHMAEPIPMDEPQDVAVMWYTPFNEVHIAKKTNWGWQMEGNTKMYSWKKLREFIQLDYRVGSFVSFPDFGDSIRCESVDIPEPKLVLAVIWGTGNHVDAALHLSNGSWKLAGREELWSKERLMKVLHSMDEGGIQVIPAV